MTVAAEHLATLRAMTKSESDPFGRTWNLHIDARERRFWLRCANPSLGEMTYVALARKTWAELGHADRLHIKSAVSRVAGRAALLLSNPAIEDEQNATLGSSAGN